MSTATFDVEVTYASSPLRLLLFVCRDLLHRGYGGLRFYSHVDEGWGGVPIWVHMYCVMDERGRGGEQLAYTPFFGGRFDNWPHPSTYPTAFENYVERGLSVAQATTEFEHRYGTRLDACRAESDPDYIAWYDEVLAFCREDGFPITEEPQRRGYGQDGNMSEIRFMQDHISQALHRRPPGFENTSFPHREMLWQLKEKHVEAQEARRKANYAEWQRRVAEIDQRRKG